jgi:hypothetical protein
MWLPKLAKDREFFPTKKKKNGVADASQPNPEDACKDCLSFWKRSAGWLQWNSFVRLRTTDKTFKAETDDAMKELKPVDAPSTVEQQNASGIFVFRRGLFMDREEFVGAVGRQPEDCRAIALKGVNEFGKAVSGYPVAHPGKGGREFMW